MAHERTAVVIAAGRAVSALPTMIADDMAPEAYSRAHLCSGIAAVMGFILAAFPATIE